MVILKKLKAATLIETLTASVIIIVVFMVASLSFNNVFMNSLKSDNVLLENRMREIDYFSGNKKILFPFYEEKEYWIITGEKRPGEIYFEIENLRNSKKSVLIIKQDGD